MKRAFARKPSPCFCGAHRPVGEPAHPQTVMRTGVARLEWEPGAGSQERVGRGHRSPEAGKGPFACCSFCCLKLQAGRGSVLRPQPCPEPRCCAGQRRAAAPERTGPASWAERRRLSGPLAGPGGEARAPLVFLPRPQEGHPGGHCGAAAGEGGGTRAPCGGKWSLGWRLRARVGVPETPVPGPGHPPLWTLQRGSQGTEMPS